MKFKAANPRVSFDIIGRMSLAVDVDHECKSTVREQIGALQDKPLSVEIKQFRNRRSLDANAYFWVMCEKIAAAIRSSKDEVYLDLLSRYGVFTHIIVKPVAVERVKAEWRTVRDLGEVTVNGNTGIQLQCFFGSSTYDTKEMSRLIDGAVTDAQALDIETATPAEIALLKEAWGR